MTRRFWPAALAAAAILIFGSYLVYTQYMVRRFKERTAIDTRIYSLVQRGLLVPPGGAGELEALFEIQALIDSLDVPMVHFNAADEAVGWMNVRTDVELRTPAGQAQARAIADRLQGRNPSNRAVAPDGGTIYFGDPPLLAWLRWVPYLQVGGGLMLALIAVALLRAELRAERERLWAAMARELAHQMGTPLSSLAGWLEVLALPREQREAVAADDHVVQVMAADIERLERVSRRFELIGKQPALDWVRPEEVIDELVGYFEPRLPKLGKGILLRTRITERLPPLRANKVLLIWALENVVKNAVDALAGRGGRILITVGTAGDDVHLTVADDGPGIDAAIRDRIFEAGVTTKSGGWGVGLSLTRRIIEHVHSGRIEVRSRRRGGAVFDIVLPVVEA